MRNNPIHFIDPTGHREESGYEGNQRPLDCKKYGQYCNVFGKSKSSDELAEMRKLKSTGSSNSDGHSCNGPNPSVVCLPASSPDLELDLDLTLLFPPEQSSQGESFEGYSNPDIDALYFFWEKL